ncbi:MAG: CusA/CzcA family heavy metal efflux RND transporter [Archangium sp.]
MLEKLISWSLKNRGAVVFLSVLVGVIGYFAFRDLTIEAFPDPSDTQVSVIALFPGQPAEEVERQISLPMERALNGTPRMTRLRSLSLFGLANVTLTFEDGTDGLQARQIVLERLRDAELPEGVTPELGPYATPIGEVYRYSLEGAQGDPMKLRTLQDWVVRPAIMRTPGVADVVSYGGLIQQIQVQPLPVALEAQGLTLQDLEDAIRDGSENASGGVVARGSQQFVVRSEGLFKSVQEVGKVRVATHEGTPVYLKDVANVTVGWEPRQGVVANERSDDAIEGIVLMRRGENPSVVLDALRARIASLNERLGSDGVRVVPFYDRTELVDATLETVGHNLLEGAILVTLVLFIFLLDLRAAVIASTLIPLSLAVSFIYLRSRGLSANLLSMGAVDFGVIVDGGVVVLESVLVALAANSATKGTLAERVEHGARRVVRPTVFALLIIIAAYLPIFMLQRVEGRIFSPMANTVASALLGALIFSVTLVPVLASLLYRRTITHGESPVLKLALKAYVPVLKFALRRPVVVVVAALLSLGISVAMVPKLGSEFLPEINEGGIYLTMTLPQDVAMNEGRKLVPRLLSRIAALPVVDDVMSQLGRPEDGTDPKLANNLEMFVKLKPAKDWPQGVRTVSDVVALLSTSVDELTGVEVNFSQPIGDNVNESIAGQQGQIALKFFGDDLNSLQDLAERAKHALEKVPGAADVALVKSGSVQQIQVTPDRDALARYGLSLGGFQHAFQTAMGGRPVSEYWEGERRFDVVLRLPETERDDVEKIRKLRISVEGGTLVPLETLAHVTSGEGRASISRENGKRYIGVRMNVRGRDMGSFVDEARSVVSVLAPDGGPTRTEWGGEFESKERAMRRLGLVVPVAVLITLLLLFNAYGSIGRALVTLGNVPFALIGGVVGLWLAHMPLSVAAAVGFIALIGQASLNGVLVTMAIVSNREAGQSLDEAIISGCVEKLRPVLMTAALAALGLLPAVISRGMGSETQKPLAVVIVFGTLTAFALTMVLLPVLFRAYARIFEPETPSDGDSVSPDEHAPSASVH